MLRSKSLLTAVIAIGLSGCGEPANTHEKAPISASPKHGQGETASKATEQGRGLIRAGYGTAMVHLGQPVEELQNGWVKVAADKYTGSDMPYMDNKNQGIEIEYEDGKILTIFFYYIGDGWTPYGHGTDKGIDAKASVDDVRAKYGDPSFIEAMTTARPGSKEIHVSYVEDGIQFRFGDSKLEAIVVSKPKLDFDYDRYRALMKDWLVYIRPSKK